MSVSASSRRQSHRLWVADVTATLFLVAVVAGLAACVSFLVHGMRSESDRLADELIARPRVMLRVERGDGVERMFGRWDKSARDKLSPAQMRRIYKTINPGKSFALKPGEEVNFPRPPL